MPAVAAVDECEQFHFLGSPEVDERIQAGTDGSSRIEYVIHQHDLQALDHEIHIRCTGGKDLSAAEIVPIEGHVQFSQADLSAFQDAFQMRFQAAGDENASRLESDQCSLGKIPVILDELIAQSLHRDVEAGGVGQGAFLHSRSQGRMFKGLFQCPRSGRLLPAELPQMMAGVLGQ